MKLKPNKTYLCINSKIPIFTKGKTYSTIERKSETLIRDDNSLYWPVSYLGYDDVSFSQIEKQNKPTKEGNQLKLKPNQKYLCTFSKYSVFTKGKTYTTEDSTEYGESKVIIQSDIGTVWFSEHLNSNSISFKLIEPSQDNTNPQHYQKPIEPIKYMEENFSDEAFTGYLEGNIIKYISRYRDKNGVEDLKKAKNYLERLIKKVDK